MKDILDAIKRLWFVIFMVGIIIVFFLVLKFS